MKSKIAVVILSNKYINAIDINHLITRLDSQVEKIFNDKFSDATYDLDSQSFIIDNQTSFKEVA